MKNIYLAFKMICKQKILNTLLIVTMLFSIYYLLPLLYQTIHYMSASQTLSGLEVDNAYYLFRKGINYSEPAIDNSIKEMIESLDYIEGRAEIYWTFDENTKNNVYIYNDTLIEKFKPQINEGDWFSNDYIEDGYLTAIVGQETELQNGEIFTVNLQIGEEAVKIKCKVIALLDSPTQYLDFSGVADEENFTTDFLIGTESNTIILPLSEKIQELITNQKNLRKSSGSIIYTNREVTYEEMKEKFGRYGVVTDISSGNSKFIEQTRMCNVAMGAYFMVYFLITIMCLICTSIILNVNSQKNYTIYFLAGMTAKRKVLLEGIRIAIMILISTFISFLFIIRFGILSAYFETGQYNFILAIIFFYICIIFIPVSIFFIKKDRRTDLMDLIHNLSNSD